MNEAVLQSDTLTVRINLDQGAEITHIVPKGGENILFFGDWKSPLPAGTSQTYGSGHLDWLSAYRGGWQEMFPNAGNPGTVLGAPMPFHGEVSRTAWTATQTHALTSAGSSRGTTILRSVVHHDAPLMRAASSSSLCTCRMAAPSTREPNGRKWAVSATTMIQMVP